MTREEQQKVRRRSLLEIGWREWISLPELGVEKVKVKVDSGARSSSLHAFDIELVESAGGRLVLFRVHPLQRNSTTTVSCEAPLHDERWVRSSNGKREHRPVIRTMVTLAGASWPIDVTLTSRDAMGFRMLLGREAVRGRFLLNPGRSYLHGRPGKRVSDP